MKKYTTIQSTKIKCRRFGLSTLCFFRRFGLLTFWFVDVLVCRRFGCRCFGLSTFWPVIIHGTTIQTFGTKLSLKLSDTVGGLGSWSDPTIILVTNFNFAPEWWQNMRGVIASFMVLSHFYFPPLPCYRILKWMLSHHRVIFDGRFRAISS